MIYKFTDVEELGYISQFVQQISNIYDHSAAETIDRLARKIINCNGMIELSEDTYDNNDYNELLCLFNIVDTLRNVSAEHVNAADTVYKELKGHVIPSNVPRFLAMLNENDIDPRWCDNMFGHWASKEGMGQLAIDCMEIQSKHLVNMTGVYEWLYNYNPIPDIDWKEDVERYREEVY